MQADIHDRLKNLKVPPHIEQVSLRESDATKRETEPTYRSQVSSQSPDLTDIRVGVSNIKDMEGFEKRRQEKLDNIFEPQNVQIFDVEKSRYLYEKVTK